MRLTPLVLVACVFGAAVACGIDAVGTQPIDAPLPDGSTSSSGAPSSSSGDPPTDSGVDAPVDAPLTDVLADAADVVDAGPLVPPYLVLTSSVPGATPIDLATEGTTDWAYWGANGSVSSTRRALSTGLSSLYFTFGAPVAAATGFGATITWSGGESGSMGSGDWYVWYPSATTDYFYVRAPAGPVKQTLVVGVGGVNIHGRMTASFTDGSTPAKVDTTYQNLAGTITAKYVLEYASVAPTQVELRWQPDLAAVSGAELRFTFAALR